MGAMAKGSAWSRAPRPPRLTFLNLFFDATEDYDDARHRRLFYGCS